MSAISSKPPPQSSTKQKRPSIVDTTQAVTTSSTTSAPTEEDSDFLKTETFNLSANRHVGGFLRSSLVSRPVLKKNRVVGVNANGVALSDFMQGIDQNVDSAAADGMTSSWRSTITDYPDDGGDDDGDEYRSRASMPTPTAATLTKMTSDLSNTYNINDLEYDDTESDTDSDSSNDDIEIFRAPPRSARRSRMSNNSPTTPRKTLTKEYNDLTSPSLIGTGFVDQSSSTQSNTGWYTINNLTGEKEGAPREMTEHRGNLLRGGVKINTSTAQKRGSEVGGGRESSFDGGGKGARGSMTGLQTPLKQKITHNKIKSTISKISLAEVNHQSKKHRDVYEVFPVFEKLHFHLGNQITRSVPEPQALSSLASSTEWGFDKLTPELDEDANETNARPSLTRVTSSKAVLNYLMRTKSRGNSALLSGRFRNIATLNNVSSRNVNVIGAGGSAPDRSDPFNKFNVSSPDIYKSLDNADVIDQMNANPNTSIGSSVNSNSTDSKQHVGKRLTLPVNPPPPPSSIPPPLPSSNPPSASSVASPLVIAPHALAMTISLLSPNLKHPPTTNGKLKLKIGIGGSMPPPPPPQSALRRMSKNSINVAAPPPPPPPPQMPSPTPTPANTPKIPANTPVVASKKTADKPIGTNVVDSASSSSSSSSPAKSKAFQVANATPTNSPNQALHKMVSTLNLPGNAAPLNNRPGVTSSLSLTTRDRKLSDPDSLTGVFANAKLFFTKNPESSPSILPAQSSLARTLLEVGLKGVKDGSKRNLVRGASFNTSPPPPPTGTGDGGSASRLQYNRPYITSPLLLAKRTAPATTKGNDGESEDHLYEDKDQTFNSTQKNVTNAMSSEMQKAVLSALTSAMMTENNSEDKTDKTAFSKKVKTVVKGSTNDKLMSKHSERFAFLRCSEDTSRDSEVSIRFSERLSALNSDSLAAEKDLGSPAVDDKFVEHFMYQVHAADDDENDANEADDNEFLTRSSTHESSNMLVAPPIIEILHSFDASDANYDVDVDVDSPRISRLSSHSPIPLSRLSSSASHSSPNSVNLDGNNDARSSSLNENASRFDSIIEDDQRKSADGEGGVDRQSASLSLNAGEEMGVGEKNTTRNNSRSRSGSGSGRSTSTSVIGNGGERKKLIRERDLTDVQFMAVYNMTRKDFGKMSIFKRYSQRKSNKNKRIMAVEGERIT